MRTQGKFAKVTVYAIAISFVCGNSGISYAAYDKLRPAAIAADSAVAANIKEELVASFLKIEAGDYREFKGGEGKVYNATGKKIFEEYLDSLRETIIEREPSLYGPHPSQEELRPLYERIAWARKNKPANLEIANIYAFISQKHGREVREAVSLGVVLKGGRHIILPAPVMGGISAGAAEPDTHKNIKDAIDFFNKNIKYSLVGFNISQPDEIDAKISQIDEEFRNKAKDKTKPKFSYIGAELAIGISMMSTIALSEALHVPVEVVVNYRYNEYCLKNGLAKAVRPISIPVNYSVVWEGGKHGAAKTLDELFKEGIIKDISRFPEDFKDPLAMVPPQELQVMVFAPHWKEAHRIGVALTKAYKKQLEEEGIKTKYGDESGLTTEQIRSKDGRLITLELVLDILEKAVNSLPAEDAKYVKYALDLASSEFYIPEIDMYYIGPAAAGNNDGLVNNEEFTRYKLNLFKKYSRFTSCEDWADENKPEHWEDAKQIMPFMIQMGDDNAVSRHDLIRKYTEMGVMNAHLQKPNQSTTEGEAIKAVGTSHSLGNVVVTSHRGTRSPQELYTAWAAIGMGTFGGKWTLWGPGRGALIDAMNQTDELYNSGITANVSVPYQGALVLDPNGPYKDAGWAKRIRRELGIQDKKSEEPVPAAIKEKQEVAKPEPSALVVSAGFLKYSLGAFEALEAAAREFSDNITVVFYGEDSKKLAALVDGKNVFAAENAQDAKRHLNESGVKDARILWLQSARELSDVKTEAISGIKKIVVPENSPAVAALGLSVSRLLSADNHVLDGFLEKLNKAGVVQADKASRRDMLAKLESAASLLPADIGLTPQKAAEIEKEKDKLNNFLTKIGI